MLERKTIEKVENNGYNYNVKVWNSLDGGKSWIYTGNGRFFKNLKEAEKYARTWREE